MKCDECDQMDAVLAYVQHSKARSMERPETKIHRLCVTHYVALENDARRNPRINVHHVEVLGREEPTDAED